MSGQGARIGDRSCEWWCDHPEEAAAQFVPEPPGDHPGKVDALSGIAAVLLWDQGGKRAVPVIRAMMERMDDVSTDMLSANLSQMRDRLTTWSEIRAEGMCPHCRTPLIACTCEP